MWTDYKLTAIEDQQKFAVPLNSATETLFYNHRMIIDSHLYNKDSQPRAWLISKINRISPNGIARITLAQDTYDQHKDFIECDENGNIIGMWADWFKSQVAPTEIIPDIPDAEPVPDIVTIVSCSGKQQIKIGGSAKTFTVVYESQGQEVEHAVGRWDFYIDDTNVYNLFEITEEANKAKAKFLGDDSYIGKILTVSNVSEDTVGSLDIELIGL